MKYQILVKLERILLIISIIGLVLLLLKVEFAGTLLTVSIYLLALFYLVQTFLSFKLWKKSKAIAITNAALNLTLVFLVLGILYIIMFFPGGHIMVEQTIKIYFAIIAIGLIYFLIKGKEAGLTFWNGIKNSFIKFSIILVLAFVLYLLPFNILLDAFAKDPQLIRERVENYNQ